MSYLNVGKGLIIKQILLTLILVIGRLSSFAQLPEFEFNISAEESNNSILKKELIDRYNYIIFYYCHFYWSENHKCLILGCMGRSWKFVKWSFELDDVE